MGVRVVVSPWVLGYAVALSIILVPPLSSEAAGTEDYIHSRLGAKYKSENKYEPAIEEFRKVLAAHPDNFNAYMHLAEIREVQGRYRLAAHN
ncbi:MAG: hypothetical protein GF363_01400, partial [Chitinivibrionales bacterium]|nr:hypothetical protein [Chitinivibrionales bacterium]